MSSPWWYHPYLSPQSTEIGRLELRRVKTNGFKSSLIRDLASNPRNKRVCMAGNTCVALSPLSSPRAGTTSFPNFRVLNLSTVINGSKSSSHCADSMPSGHLAGEIQPLRTSSCSTRDVRPGSCAQSCAIDKTCQSGWQHEIPCSSFPRPTGEVKVVFRTSERNSIEPRLSDLSISVRSESMNRGSCGLSKVSWLKNLNATWFR